MPVAAGIDERHLPPLGLTNYWGYNPVALPGARPAPGAGRDGGGARRRRGAAGGRHRRDPRRGAQPQRRGRRARPDPVAARPGRRAPSTACGRTARYANDAGCGNTLALDRPWPLRLAMDALRHWVLAAGVDGFRLDLATTLARRDSGFDPHAPLLAAMRQDPRAARPHHHRRALGHRPGRLPARRVSRRAGASGTTASATTSGASGAAMPGMVGALATRLAGSADAVRRAAPADRQRELRHRA